MTVERQNYEVDPSTWTPLVFPAFTRRSEEPQWTPSYPGEEPPF